MLNNFEDKLESMKTETDKIEHTLGIIMDKKYSLNAGFKYFLEKGEHLVS